MVQITITLDNTTAAFYQHVSGLAGLPLETVLSDTAAYAGTELIRRTVGMANVKDVTTIADEAKRARAEKICITAGIDFIKNRAEKRCGNCFLNTLKDAIKAVDAQ